MNNAPLFDNNLAAEILKTVGAIICVMDSTGRIVLFNKAAEELTGYSFAEIKGRYPWDVFILPEETDAVRHVFSRLTSGHFPNNHTNYWLTKHGERRLLDWSNTALVDDSGEIEYVIATAVDITKQKQAEDEIRDYQLHLEEKIDKRTRELKMLNEQLDKISRLDATTGIFNRRHFDEVLDVEIRRCKRQGLNLSLLLCDVDNFKLYNDTYGHVEGDACLREIASVLSDNLNRATDVVSRYGGEEFAIILPGMHGGEAMEMGKRLVDAIRSKRLAHIHSPIENIITISIGAVSFEADQLSTAEALVQAADKALYHAKESGRNNIKQYDGSMDGSET
ncbi:MAG: diguanylate cyclase [Gammaproteobacteria bacterium]|nr:diguanylate cyclase [Gammaproteobacteria bacterium]